MRIENYTWAKPGRVGTVRLISDLYTNAIALKSGALRSYCNTSKLYIGHVGRSPAFDSHLRVPEDDWSRANDALRDTRTEWQLISNESMQFDHLSGVMDVIYVRIKSYTAPPFLTLVMTSSVDLWKLLWMYGECCARSLICIGSGRRRTADDWPLFGHKPKKFRRWRRREIKKLVNEKNTYQKKEK